MSVFDSESEEQPDEIDFDDKKSSTSSEEEESEREVFKKDLISEKERVSHENSEIEKEEFIGKVEI